MKIVLPGGSGQIGQLLAREYTRRGWQVVILTRSTKPLSVKENVSVAHWDAKSAGPWCEHLEGADVVVNLAGRSVDCRYNEANRRQIIDSRVDSTRAVVNGILNAKNPPAVLLQSSTATIYSHRYDKPNDDVTGIIGGEEPGVPETWRFSIGVAKTWEAAATERELPQTRRVLLRSAMVMSPDPGGVFSVLLRLVRLGLGGTNGDGRQFVSWIHDNDFVAAIDWILDHKEICGPVNLASPNPLPNRNFMRTLRSAWGQPIGLPATKWMLEIGAIFLRTESELILKSRRVVPTRLANSGFEFQFPQWEAAARDLCDRYRNPSQ